MKNLALFAIHFYQRFVSPYKGFCCAYRAHTGGASCSGLGYRAIRRFGLWQGLGILRNRLAECGRVYRQHLARPKSLRGQTGFCDAPCDLPCDLPDMDCAGSACDLLADLPCDCGDWGSSDRKKRKPDKPSSRFSSRYKAG